MPENWTGLKIFPESIPHLLHWDFAYLWLLRKPEALRPAEWQARCESWERLLAYYLLGDLEVRTSAISPPLLAFTEPFGITEVRKLFYQGILVGVCSPAVIVRPLPDSAPDLPELPPVAPEKAPELRYMLGLLLDSLTNLAASGGDRPLQKELRHVGEELAHRRGTYDPSVRWKIRHEPSVFLRRVAFDSTHAAHERDLRQIAVSQRKGTTRLFVPLCRHSGCGRSLAREAMHAEAIPVTGDSLTLSCPEGHPNDLSLSSLFIWLRSPKANALQEAVCWADREGDFRGSLENAEFPPECRISEDWVSFTWHSAVMPQYDRERTVLKLRFPGRKPAAHSLFKEAFYERLLVPGCEPAAFSGLPIRSEWVDAWRGYAGTTCETGSYRFHGLEIAGLPFSFDYVYVSGRVDRRDKLAPAIYPRRMHDAWRPYRVMALGENEAQFRVIAPRAAAILPNLIEVEGWPEFVSVESAVSQGSGATWNERDVSAPLVPAGTIRPRVCLGIDFGTSNTVVYFQAQDDHHNLSARDNGLSPQGIMRQFFWLATPLAESWALPLKANPTQDEYLFPSAMWRMGPSGPFLIRWNPSPPRAGCTTEESFKWDAGIASRRDVRDAYLREMLFHGLPVMLDRLNARGAQPGLEIGFAFPLAFEYAKRQDFVDVVRGLCDWLRDRAGFEANPSFTNESLASVRVQGAFNPGELFIVADMGGRTLDVALFSYHGDPARQTDRSNMHQIGSVDFGGELFLRSAAQTRASAKGDAEAEYWKLRDQIHDGTAALQGSFDRTILALLNRFQPMALEFLRILVEAFRDARPGETGKIRLLLVGNGWRLRELFADQRDPAFVFQRYFADALRAIGINQFELGETRIQGIPNSKHWVACGSLYNARQSGATRQGDTLSRLPSGLSFEADGQPVKWSDLMGDDGWASTNANSVQTIVFDRSSGPRPSAPWLERLHECFGSEDPLPPDSRLREALIAGFSDSRFRRGPVAVILEDHWKNLLWPH